MRRALARCDAVWALSEAQLGPLRRMWRLPEERVHYVPFGIDAEFWTPGADASPVDPDSVLAVGNDVHRDHPLVVASVGLVQQTRPATRLRLVSRHDVAVPAGLGVREPARTHPELRAHYRSSAVVALAMRPNLHCSGITPRSRRWRALGPLSPRQRRACTITSTDGVTGLLVPVGDRQAMSAAIASLLAEPEARGTVGPCCRGRRSSRGSPQVTWRQRLAGLVN